MNQALKDLFLSHSQMWRPISYQQFKNAGIDDIEYMQYCNICELVRSACFIACIIKGNNKNKVTREILSDSLSLLKNWIENKIGESYKGEIQLSEYELKWYVYYFVGSFVAPPYGIEDTRVLSLIYLSSEDFRWILEILIRVRIILGKKRPSWNFSYKEPPKLSKKEKRETCEYYTASKCLLRQTPCVDAYCYDYEKDSKLPIKKLPTESDQVDFLDTVCIQTIDDDNEKIQIVMPNYRDQLSMKPVEKAVIHKRIGDIILVGETKYKILSVKKHKQDIPRRKKPICLLSEWQKAKIRLEKLEEEYESIDVPERPLDLGDTASLVEWAKDAVRCINEHEELEAKIYELEEQLDL